MRTHSLAAIFALVCSIPFAYSAMCGNTCTTADCTWEDTTKWNCSAVPTAADDVSLTSTAAYTLTSSAAASAKSLVVGSTSGTSKQNVVFGSDLVVTGLWTVNRNGVVSAKSFKSANLNIMTGATFNWLGGTAEYQISSNTFTVQPGAFFAIPENAAPTLKRDMQVNGTLTIGNGVTLTLDGSKLSTAASGSTTIGSATFAGGSADRLYFYSPVTFNAAATFGLRTILSNAFNVPSGVDLQFNAAAEFATATIANGGSITIGGGSSNFFQVTVNGAFNWKDGNIQMAKPSQMTISSGATATFGSDSMTGDITLQTNPNSLGDVYNMGTLTIQGPVGSAVKSDAYTRIHSSGGLVINNNFEPANLEILGGDVTGPAQIYTSNAFNWTAGTINVNVGATGKVIIGGSGVKRLDSSSLGIQSTSTNPATITGTVEYASKEGGVSVVVHNNAGSKLLATAATFKACEECQFTGGQVVNDGTATGYFTINSGIEFVNNGQLGGDSSVVTTVNVQGPLTLGASSQVIFDIWGKETSGNTRTAGSISATGMMTLAGTAVVRLKKGFMATDDVTIKVISYNPDLLTGDFSSPVTIDTSNWDNAYGCDTPTVAQDTSKNGWIVRFSGCTYTPPPPPGGKGSVRTSTILIIVLVFGVIVFVVGLTAWCKKKYRKRPWDRLHTSRL
eukprot:TRINITY_DN749_c0_g1_i1.p1 TRINITY_DN749_c0_g1~~TRINITY_DN749_c0_g1_i1.p1  ORF type:complete len:675 (-),score=166.83 TRINITY_DN749_c0_g1_i1:69-2093(-)